MRDDFRKWRISQITLPDTGDLDPHPRIRVNGRGIHAGESFTALLPDGWKDITLEISWDSTGPDCWYISTPGLSDICPVGLFVRI